MRNNKTLAMLVLFATLSYFGANTGAGKELVSLRGSGGGVRQVVCSGSGATGTFCVVHVVDGDTVDLDMEGRVVRARLIGINTPETVDPRKPVECFGKEASNKAKETLLGKWVTIETDPSQDVYDKYGRMLVYVYTSDGASFNKMMIASGNAHEYTYRYPYKYQQEFKTAEREARAEKRGLWAPDVCTS